MDVWLIVLSCYVAVVTALVAVFFLHPVSAGHRGFMVVVLTWMVCVFCGPVILAIGLYGFFRSLFKR